MARLIIAILICATQVTVAQDLPQLACEGSAPEWNMTLAGPQAQFTYGKTYQMDIPQRSQAEGRDWPKALTLLGDGQTAIVILNERSCDTAHVTAFPIEANILTQKGETPVILYGCCAVAE